MTLADKLAVVGGGALLLALLVQPAGAYTYDSVVGEGCHEMMSSHALRQLRQELATAAPLHAQDQAARQQDDILVDELPFVVDHDMTDIGAVAMLLGVRDNDIKGYSGINTRDLARVHGNPGGQDEHCLRHPDHDEPNGSLQSLQTCRIFIRTLARQAIDSGLNAAGYPDVNLRIPLLVTLPFSGQVQVQLPTFYVFAGQAIHTIQDSYSHTFRTTDGTRITTIMNWVEVSDEEHDESRDGPPHMMALDVCDDPDSFRKWRRLLATTASLDLLRATLDPELTRAEKYLAVDEVIDRYMTFQPGCTYDNNWCDAAENVYRDAALCGCRLVGIDEPSSGLRWLIVFALGLTSARARRRPRGLAQRRQQ